MSKRKALVHLLQKEYTYLRENWRKELVKQSKARFKQTKQSEVKLQG